MNWPVHSYGTGGIPTMVHQAGQMMFQKNQQQRQDKKDLTLLKEKQKNTAFDQGMQLLNIYPKYEKTAPAAASKIANQSAQFFKAAGYEFDLNTIVDATEAKKLLQTKTIEKMEELSKSLFMAPKDQDPRIDQDTQINQNINTLSTWIRQAKQAGVDPAVVKIYEGHITEARKRRATNLTDRRKREAADLANTRKVEAARKIAAQKGKPTPVNWTTASRNVGHRFGKEDAMGNIIITPELQGMNRIAQKKLVELKRTGKTNPLDAVNISEDFARNVENRYWEYLNATKGNKALIAKVKSQFRKKYGYIPKRKSSF